MARLRDDGGSDVERRLLASAADDEMPEERYRALVKWGAEFTPASAPPVTPTWKLTIVKGLGLLVLTAISVGVAERVAGGPEAPAAPPSDVHETSNAGATGAALAGGASTALAPSSSAPIPVVSLDELPSAPAPMPSSASSETKRAPKARASADRDASFAEQMRLIDSARSKLRRDDPRGTLAVLDEYERRFPRPAFEEEATVLRVSALAKAGDRAQARRIGETFLRAHPSELYSRRVEAVVRALDEQEATP